MTELNFSSEGFSIRGRRVNDLDWYEFDTFLGGKEFKDIGGENRSHFLRRLADVLSMQTAQPVQATGYGRYCDLVGGDGSVYVGYLVVSGYNTFYFFARGGALSHVVFADRDGTPLGHVPMQSGLYRRWPKPLSGNRC